MLGWDLSRETLAKIETQIRWVADCELLCLAHSLRVPVETLLPQGEQAKETMKAFFKGNSAV